MTRITILLCTYNGARHLDAQLRSYVAQDHVCWDLWVSDDGSDDDTLAILQGFQAEQAGVRDVRIMAGPRRGATWNFLSLLARPDLPRGPVALSDQDDVWLPHKLSRALAGLEQAGPVALYAAQSRYTDADLVPFGRTPVLRKPPSFANALTQNVVSGHSACLSEGAVALARRAGPRDVPFHDWWLYQLISGAGGTVVSDPEIVALYRQHGRNVLGAHGGALASARRVAMILGRDYGRWMAQNQRALADVADLLTEENRARLAQIAAAPIRPGLARPRALAQAGLHRQTRLSNAVFYAAASAGLL